MRLLLDTHALIWALTDPGQLSAAAHNAIQDQRNEVYASSVNAWEVSIKHHNGKLPEAAHILAVYHASLAKARFLELLISSEHGIQAGGLTWAHRDPFDRLLVAQAQLEGMTLVTSDAVIQQSALVAVLW